MGTASKLRRFRRQTGVSALEVVVIASAFLAIASAFGGVVLTTGLASSDRVNRTLNDAAARSSGGIELRGPVIAMTDGQKAKAISVDVSLAVGGGAVSLEPGAPVDRTVVNFTDRSNAIRELPYSVKWTVGDGDAELERGELAAVLIDVSQIAPALISGSTFQIELRPPRGSYLTIRRTLRNGGFLDTIVNLN